MRKFLAALFIFATCVALSAPPAARAGALEKLSGCVVALVEKHYLKLIDYPENRVLLLKDKSNDDAMVGIALKDKLGAGFFGSVVRVDFISDPDIENQIRTHDGIRFDGGLVAKFPHALKLIGMGRPLFFTQKESRNEVADYGESTKAIPKIEQAAAYPKDPAWSKGRMPVVPILGTLNTERGLIIFKPELVGKGLKQVAQEFAANGGKLPDQYVRGLRDIYDFVQAVYAGKNGQATDIRPPNLLWVEDPALLRFLGYKRPGFVLFELSKVAGNHPQYINGKGESFEEYKEEYEYYLNQKLQGD